MKLISSIRQWYSDHPLQAVLVTAFIVRLLAVFFAKGYMWHDDHFLTVEPSSSWAAGHNFNNWLPGIGNNRAVPEPISFFYLGFLFLFFKVFHLLGIDNPDTQMYLMRLIHAAYSLLTVFLAYRISELISGKKNAFRVAILLALIGVIPNYSVRNLVEFVCQPPLLFGFFLLVKGTCLYGTTERRSYSSFLPAPVGYYWKNVIAAAFVMGLAVGFRYQTVLIVGGVGLVLLLQQNFFKAVVFGIVSFAAFFLTQSDDVVLWGGRPFQHLLGYFEYNKSHAGGYPNAPLTYLSLIGYVILPPVSLFLAFGFFRCWKKHLLIFLPVLFFIVFHLLFPNKQERFLFPAIPFIVLLGVIGWSDFVAHSAFWKTREALHRQLWRFFWIVNTLVLFVMSTTYSKKSKVEAMLYLNRQGDCRNFIQEFTYTEEGQLVPEYYLGKWVHYYVFSEKTDVEYLVSIMEESEEAMRNALTPQPVPNYILFINDNDIEERVQRMQELFPGLTYSTTIYPGWFDIFLNFLNPLNTLEKIYIYKIG